MRAVVRIYTQNCQALASARGKLTLSWCSPPAATFMAPASQPESAGATDSRDLLERLMIAFKYISAELDPYIAQVLVPSRLPAMLALPAMPAMTD